MELRNLLTCLQTADSSRNFRRMRLHKNVFRRRERFSVWNNVELLSDAISNVRIAVVELHRARYSAPKIIFHACNAILVSRAIRSEWRMRTRSSATSINAVLVATTRRIVYYFNRETSGGGKEKNDRMASPPIAWSLTIFSSCDFGWNFSLREPWSQLNSIERITLN